MRYVMDDGGVLYPESYDRETVIAEDPGEAFERMESSKRASDAMNKSSLERKEALRGSNPELYAKMQTAIALSDAKLKPYKGVRYE